MYIHLYTNHFIYDVIIISDGFSDSYQGYLFPKIHYNTLPAIFITFTLLSFLNIA
jgi:hypothetical protein